MHKLVAGTPSKVSELMARIRSKGNETTELKFVRMLRQRRIWGWRRHAKIAGTPDVVFPKIKLAVFLDGCFWHGCPRCYRPPKTNAQYWIPKIARNKARDAMVTAKLKEKGWRVLRFWECGLDEKTVTLRLRKMLKSKMPLVGHNQ